MDIVAGPQGSGKSTFFPVEDRGCDAFNIDQRRKELNGGSSQNIPAEVSRRAIAEYETFIEAHISDRQSFSFEATLAKEITFEQAIRARKRGFQVHLTYLATELGTSVERVKKRVLVGGHGTSAAVIRDTYLASMRNLPRAIQLFDVVQIYDNSVQATLDESLEEAKPHLVLESQGGVVTYVAPAAPGWLRSALSGSEYDLA